MSSSSTPHALYEHRQTGWPMLGFACIPSLCLVMILSIMPDPHQPLPRELVVGLGALTAMLVAGFGSLSIVVTRDHLRARFGIGLVRKTVALDEVVAVEVTTTRWYEGWGIHWTRRGVLYNVAGLDAVRVLLVGGKAVMFGSDDAPRLASTLRRTIDDRRRASGA